MYSAEVGGLRKAVMIAAAVLLLLEAVGIVILNWVMGIVVDRQQMSLAGVDPDAMSIGTWVLGAVNGIFLAVVAVVLLRAAIRDRAPGRLGRILVIVCAVVHAVVGAAVVGLVGWAAFVGAMVVLGLLVLSVLMFREDGVGGTGEGGGEGGAAADRTPPEPGPAPASTSVDPTAEPGPSPA